MYIKKLFFLSLGSTFLGIGAIGIVLPLLPTTPFVLAAFVCFTKCSKKAEIWVSNNRYFGSYIENYKHKKGVPWDVKVKSILFLWFSLMASLLFFQQDHLFIILPLVGLGVTAHILSFKTQDESE